MILGGELLIPALEEVLDLGHEFIHKILYMLYADVFGMVHEEADKTAAWTGLIIIVGLLGYGFYRLVRAMPGWWANHKAEFKDWWQPLPWYLQLGYVLGGVALLGGLAMII